MTTKTFDYEKSYKKLETIIEKFEGGELKSLDESIKLFKEAMEIASSCKKHLKEVENTITTLKTAFEEEDATQSQLDLD